MLRFPHSHPINGITHHYEVQKGEDLWSRLQWVRSGELIGDLVEGSGIIPPCVLGGDGSRWMMLVKKILRLFAVVSQ
eukprot:c37227_g1_i1 orf=93-323(+)